MTFTEKIEFIKCEMGSIPHDMRAAYTNGMNLRTLYQEREAEFIGLLSDHAAPLILNLGNAMSYSHGLIDVVESRRIADLKFLFDLSEASPAFKAAHALIQPKIDQIAELKAEIEAEQIAHGQRLQALSDAEETARTAALATVDKDPAVVKARQALLTASEIATAPASEPVRLTRGRQKLAADEAEEPT